MQGNKEEFPPARILGFTCCAAEQSVTLLSQESFNGSSVLSEEWAGGFTGLDWCPHNCPPMMSAVARLCTEQPGSAVMLEHKASS